MAFLELLVSICILDLTVGQSDYPDPRIVIVGPTGAGKSSLANALLGCDPRGKSCAFAVCGGMNSCTKETSIGTGPWLGTGQNFTVVDTPGFGDSDGEDNQLIEEMINVLDGDLGYTNIILLLFDGLTARFTTGLHNMLRQMSSLFGEAWWDNMVIGVSKWKYSQAEIDQRQGDCEDYGDPSENCKNEAWFMREISGQLQDKFNLNRNFTFAFIHSHSQSGKRALNDPVQQEYYQAQAKILWDAATTRNSTFEFKTIDDVLEENELLKKKNRKLNFLFETNIATLYSLVRENAERINEHRERVDNNEKTTNANITTLLSYVHENEEQINSKVTTLLTSIQENKENTNVMKKELKDTVDNLQLTPIGTIIAWVTKPTIENVAVVDIPDGWHRCDGSMIPKPSIWAGKLAPNLNHEKRFLRGGPDSDMLNMEEDQAELRDHTHGYDDVQVTFEEGCKGSNKAYDFKGDCWRKTKHETTGSAHIDIETRPKNMNVIYIMRVW